jgi:hypothetical protein
MCNQVGLVSHSLIVKVVRRPFEEIVEHQWHEDRSDNQRNDVQENDPREDGFE